jgi:[ribosomal protein S18]-alanine N-acetyltransferase
MSEAKNIQIRKCEVKDLEQVFHLERSAFGAEGYSYLTLRQLYDVCGNLFRVAVTEEDEVIGYTIGCSKVGTSDAWILALAVSPCHQRQGIGRKLTFSLFEESNKLGIKKVLLTVKLNNDSAIGLYKSNGFSTIAHENNYFGENSPRNVMQKIL